MTALATMSADYRSAPPTSRPARPGSDDRAQAEHPVGGGDLLTKAIGQGVDVNARHVPAARQIARRQAPQRFCKIFVARPVGTAADWRAESKLGSRKTRFEKDLRKPGAVLRRRAFERDQ